MTQNGKKVITFLGGHRTWYDVNDKLPEVDKPVTIRITDPNKVYHETVSEIYPLEDIKIGRFRDGKWQIDPPYPMYDDSPLSNMGNLKEGAIVTHWSISTEDEILIWQTRFKLIHSYNKLKIEIDPDKEEDAYHALRYAAKFFKDQAQFVMEKEKVERLTELLLDMRLCINRDANEMRDDDNAMD